MPGQGLACRALALTARESDLRALTALPMLSSIVTMPRCSLSRVRVWASAGSSCMDIHAQQQVTQAFRISSAASYQYPDCVLAMTLCLMSQGCSLETGGAMARLSDAWTSYIMFDMQMAWQAHLG